MGYITKNNKGFDLKPGAYLGEVVHHEPNGSKVTRTNQVFQQGYIHIKLSNDAMVKQYLLEAPWKTFLFYKLVKAIKPELNLNEEYMGFSFFELIGEKVVVDIEYEFNGISSFPNITNVYNLEDGMKIIKHQETVEQLRAEKGILDMNEVQARAEEIEMSNDVLEIDEMNDDSFITF
ncbi:MAG: hypothetical protein ACRC7N_12600 [Clostridium sp.]